MRLLLTMVLSIAMMISFMGCETLFKKPAKGKQTQTEVKKEEPAKPAMESEDKSETEEE